MSLPLLHLSTERLDAARVADLVIAGGEPGHDGGVVTFVGVVRREHAGHVVVRVDYEAYVPLALKALARIAQEAAGHWPTARLAIHHRLGALAPGEVSVVIAAASLHRATAFEACRYAIERVKQIVPIWKHEIYEGGDAWIEGATADPTDGAVRAVAYGRACASRS